MLTGLDVDKGINELERNEEELSRMFASDQSSQTFFRQKAKAPEQNPGSKRQRINHLLLSPIPTNRLVSNRHSEH